MLGGLVTVGHATTAPPDVAVSIQGLAYQGPNGTGTFTIPLGTKVTWTNNDGFFHSSTSDATPTPLWDSGGIPSGGSFSFTFDQVGVFPYHCLFHPTFPNMHGTITVIAPPNPTTVRPTIGTSAGGTNVTITGSGFQNGATVAFGGIAATNVAVLDANTITATTPAHPAGSVDIVVTNPDTMAGTLASAFVFTALPPPQPSIAPVPGARPLPATRVPGMPDPTPPHPLPPSRPAGASPGNAPIIRGGVPAPVPLSPRR